MNIRQSTNETWRPSVPLPYFGWSFWKWQKVRCCCGKSFISSSSYLMPEEYKKHYLETHVNLKGVSS